MAHDTRLTTGKTAGQGVPFLVGGGSYRLLTTADTVIRFNFDVPDVAFERAGAYLDVTRNTLVLQAGSVEDCISMFRPWLEDLHNKGFIGDMSIESVEVLIAGDGSTSWDTRLDWLKEYFSEDIMAKVSDFAMGAESSFAAAAHALYGGEDVPGGPDGHHDSLAVLAAADWAAFDDIIVADIAQAPGLFTPAGLQQHSTEENSLTGTVEALRVDAALPQDHSEAILVDLMASVTESQNEAALEKMLKAADSYSQTVHLVLDDAAVLETLTDNGWTKQTPAAVPMEYNGAILPCDTYENSDGVLLYIHHLNS